MLLRSSSSPMLECLLASLSHDIFVDSSSCGQAAMAKSVSLSNNSLTSCQGSDSQPCIHGISRDAASPPLHANHGKDPGLSPHHPTPSRVRKVQSESDLSTLGGSLSSTRVAADTLLSDNCNTDVDGYDATLHHFSVSKRSSGLPLSHRRSLGSLPMDLPFMFFSCVRSSAIPEEVEPSSYSSTSSEEDAMESMTSVFDKLALPVTGEVTDSNHHKAGLFRLNNVNDDERKAQLYHNVVTLPKKCEDVIALLTDPGAGGCNSHQRLELAGSSVSSRMDVGGGYGGGGGSTTLVKEVCGPALGSKYGSDQMEVAFAAGGDGGKEGRPPAIVGRGGVGGWGGGGGGNDEYGHGVDMNEIHYKSMLKENPGHPLLLRNYAQFLADVKRDHGKAEEYYQRAILANPTDGELLGQYAKMVWEVQHDRERAVTYFERAVQAASDNSYVMAAYASFLWCSEEEEEEEEEEVLEGTTSKVPTALSLVTVGLA